MKKVFYVTGTLALLLAATGLAISFIRHETLVEAVEKQVSYLTVAAFMLAGTAGLSAMKESVYGGWKLEIFIGRKFLECETQAIRSSKVEKIVQYTHGWVWAFLGWGEVDFIKDDPLEKLLRGRFKSQGKIIGDPFLYISFSPNQPKTIWLDVPEDFVKRPKPD